uniref:Integrin subunit alpha 10 n=1 Tax=Sphenodon punctatus TaxID=8508 RepID=A0A8D0GA38_SPHPU
MSPLCVPHLSPPPSCPICLCTPFNIDVKRPQIFLGPQEAQFGYKVLQHAAGEQKLMLVGAPWDGTADNRKGDVYKCIVGGESNSTCAKVNLGDTALQNVSKQIKNMHFGMTLMDNKDDGFVVRNFCTNESQSQTHTSQCFPCVCLAGCSTYMDIVIVLDGSNSIYPWYEVQNFLSNILNKFFIDPDQIQVGVLQYGEIAVHEWKLNDYQTAEEVVEAAKNISRQEGRETRTAFAIHEACSEAFSPENGGREGATKLMIVVTDGESHDGEELPEALEECEKRNVTRYAIAVLGHYIRRQKDPDSFINEIKYIASDPDEKYFFNVTDEAALNDIVDALGDRIFSLEGTHEYSSFELEMSQIGFSIHLLEDGILFGTVGAYDWDGAVLKESRNGQIIPPRQAFEKEFPLELKNHAAYLGYTVSSIKLRNGKWLYVAGAPRFKHKGKVILFEMSNSGSVAISQALIGEQIGSYFGSEVCPVDVNGDGITDVLLVAAPMYLGAQNKETGRVYIYKVGQVNTRLVSNGTLQADKKPQDSRFGYSLAAVSDLNHDGFNDVVVGAPLEDNHRGAVYVYHGNRGTIMPQYKQVSDGGSPYASASCLKQTQKPHVIRKGKKKVLVDVVLENKKENAYNTTLRLWFSSNLHFASLTQLKVECTAPSAHTRSCSVSYPVFQSGAKVRIARMLYALGAGSVTQWEGCRQSDDSLESNETLADNTAQPFAYVLYEPDLFLSSESALNRYEVNAVGTFPNGVGPEFRTTVKVQNLGCYTVGNLSVSMYLPAAAYRNSFFLSVTRIIADNVSVTCILQNLTEATPRHPGVHPVHPEELMHADKLNCSNSWCQVVTCEVARLARNSEVSIRLLRVIHEDFFWTVSSGGWEEAAPSLLTPSFSLQTILEIIQPKRIPISLWILIGSIIGGLLLLALIIFCLWKVGGSVERLRKCSL